MNRSRRKNWNVVNAPSLARWIVITGLLALTGLIYVYLTIQLYHLGDQKKALEKSLADLRMQNEMAKVQIATLTSRSALQHRLKEGYLKMIPIAERDIVRLNSSRTPGDDGVQPVTNQRGGGR
jgi:hypothetical protein